MPERPEEGGRAFVVLLLAVTLCLIAAALAVASDRKLGVYSLSTYEGGWKPSVTLYDPDLNPYHTFWQRMTDPSNANHCDLQNSRRHSDADVNIRTVLTLDDDTQKGWDEYDLVFFYGHNNTIPAPHPHEPFQIWNYINGTWTPRQIDQTVVPWGTNAAPYDYWAERPTRHADMWPGAVTYLYSKYTSCLIGDPYDYGGGFIDPYGTYREHWSDPQRGWECQHLGDKDLDWLILHGCQALIVTDEYGNKPIDLAYRVFAPAHGRFHIILGHYRSFSTSDLKDLGSFADDLMAGTNGVPIQQAYFDTDPCGNTSAFAAEADQGPFNWTTSVMNQDRWLKPLPANENTHRYSERWVVPSGAFVAQWYQ